MKKKLQNSKIFTNIQEIDNKGIISLKTGQLAILYKVFPIDLSLSSLEEQKIFYQTLSKLYRLPFTIKIYEFNEMMNLNANKENYLNLIQKYNENVQQKEILINNYAFLETIEEEQLTSTSAYYIAIISRNKEALEKNKEEFEFAIRNVNPRIEIEQLKNKKILVQVFSNMYFSKNNLDQILFYDFIDLIVPMRLSEQISSLKIDNQEIQLLSIKNYPVFIEGGFLDRIVNISGVNASITINESLEQSKILNNLNSSYKAVLADYNTNKNLSDITEMRNVLDSYKMLIEQVSDNNEKIKDVSIVLAVQGDKTTREEIIKEIKRYAELYQVKIDIPRMRQLEAWQSYDLSDKPLMGYNMYLPTVTLASTFFCTKNYHNDPEGWLLGEDSAYGLPTFFDIFHLSKDRTNHNMTVVGTSGSGKSFLLKLLMINEFARGTKLFLFDIENELQKLCERCNGEYIDLSSKSLINPLQVRYVLSDNDDASILSKHLGFLENFFITAFEHIDEKELVVLIDLVEQFYATRNITKQTTLQEFEKMTPKDYPIFSDLYAFLLEKQRDCKNTEQASILSNIEVLLKRMTVGQDNNLFNGVTTIDLNNQLIVFNLQELLFNSSKRLVNTQMLNLLTYISNEVVDNKKRNDKNQEMQKMLIILDEFHNYIDEDNPMLLKYFDQLNRRARKYRLGIIIASQQPNDFTSRTNILRHASAIFNNSQYQLTGMLKDTDVKSVEQLYSNVPLTETQKSFLSMCSQGQFLLNINNKKRIRVNIFATPVQMYYMGESDEIPFKLDNV